MSQQQIYNHILLFKQVKVPVCTDDWWTKKKYTLDFWSYIFSLTLDSPRFLCILMQKQKVLSSFRFALQRLSVWGEKKYFSKPHLRRSNTDCIVQQLDIRRLSLQVKFCLCPTSLYVAYHWVKAMLDLFVDTDKRGLEKKCDDYVLRVRWHNGLQTFNRSLHIKNFVLKITTLPTFTSLQL